MELLCPQCQEKLNFAETFAGQVVRCPKCSESFTAPNLAPTVSPGPMYPDLAPLLPPDLSLQENEPLVLMPDSPQAAPTTVFDLGKSSTGEGYAFQEPPAPPAKPKPVEPPKAPAASAPPVAPMPVAAPVAGPGVEGAPKAGKLDYAHNFSVTVQRDVAVWLAPVGMSLLFFLSFFSWEISADGHTDNLWQLAFWKSTTFLVYMIVFFLAWPFAIAAFLLQKKWLEPPPNLKGFMPWASLVLAGLTAVPFLLFLIYYLGINFSAGQNPSCAAMKFAIRIHFLVVIGALLHFWLQRRASRKLPEPRITVRW